jgi:hypothetical protein
MSNNLKVTRISNAEKEIAIYEITEDDEVSFYCSNGYKTMTRAQLNNILRTPQSSTHLMLTKEKRDKKIRLLSMKEQYELFIKEANLLKEITNDRINLYKTASVTKTSLKLFYSFNPPMPDKIQIFEMEIMEYCKNGGLIFGDKYKGKAYKYDVVSQYPFVMRSDKMVFPIGEGILKTLTTEEFNELSFYQYGIYHVKISDANHKLFSQNSNNWYTHICLTRAKELQLKMELIQDDKPNFLHFSKLVNGAKLFRPFVDYLFNFKNEGYSCIKKYLNSLWGMLSKMNYFDVVTKEDDGIRLDRELTTLTPASNDLVHNHKRFKARIFKQQKAYDNDYARIKPFLAARCRYQISKIVEQNLNNVIRCFIDGIILKKRIKGIETGLNIGDLKYEGKCGDCEILNSRDYTGIFDFKK